MKKLSVSAALTMACVALILSLSACAVESESTGDLVINLRDEVTVTRNIFETSDGLDMEISYYQILVYQLNDPDNASLVTDTTVARTSDSIVIEALSPGSYALEVFGYNDSGTDGDPGEIIAYLDERGSGEDTFRYRLFDIAKGEVTTIGSDDAVLVPVVDEGSVGSLTVTVDWSALAEVDSGYEEFAASLGTPDVEVTITQMNGSKEHYETVPWTVDSSSVTEQTKTSTDVSGSSSTITFNSLPVGYYQVTAAIKSGSGAENPGVTMLERMGIVRIVAEYSPYRAFITGKVTTGTFTITDSTSFLTGSLDLSISEDMDLLTVSFTGPPSTMTANQPATFTVAADQPATGNSLTYEWYLNGELLSIVDATSEEALTLSEGGQYTLTVMVYEKDSQGAGVNFGFASTEITVQEQAL